MRVLRSALFHLLMGASVLVYAPLALCTFPLSYPLRYRFISRWARLIVHLARVICGIRWHVEGWEHLPAGPAIVLAKHQSTWETLALQELLPIQTWVLKRELLWIPFFGWGLALLKPIAIDRGAGRRAVAQIIDQGQQRLKRGVWIVVFPEGTRVVSGTTRRYGIGGAALAAVSGCPVVPVAHNAGSFWPPGKFLMHPGIVRVAIGPSITTQGKSAEEINREAAEWIEAKMKELETRRISS